MLAPKQRESLFSLVLAKQLPCTLNFISGQFLRQCRAPRFSRSSTSCSLFDKCRLRVDRRPWGTWQSFGLIVQLAGNTLKTFQNSGVDGQRSSQELGMRAERSIKPEFPVLLISLVKVGHYPARPAQKSY